MNLFRKSYQNMPAGWLSGSATSRRLASGAAILKKYTSGLAAQAILPANMMIYLSSPCPIKAPCESKKPPTANPPAVVNMACQSPPESVAEVA